MNKTRRQEISNVVTRIGMVKDTLQDILNDEQDYFDNMPENLQGSTRGMDSEEAIDVMEQVIEALEEAIENLDMIQ